MRFRQPSAVGLFAVVALLCSTPAYTQSSTLNCVHNARDLAQAVYQYTRDHWMAPPTGSQAAFEAALTPYVNGQANFRCPTTGRKYQLNALIDSIPFLSISDFGTTLVLQDSVPHADGKSSVAYLDGYVLYGGVSPFPVGDTVAFAKKLAQAILSYAQDYDETLPDMLDVGEFRKIIMPYARDSRIFDSPLTERPFEINRSLSGLPLYTFQDLSTVVLVRDLAKWPGGSDTLAFLDGSVERGGVVQPNVNEGCLSNVRRLVMAAMMYAQDYDGVLPPMESYTSFQIAVSFYARSSKAFICPATGLPYALNALLSGRNVESITDPAHTLFLWDAASHRDGKRTYGFADMHVRRK